MHAPVLRSCSLFSRDHARFGVGIRRRGASRSAVASGRMRTLVFPTVVPRVLRDQDPPPRVPPNTGRCPPSSRLRSGCSLIARCDCSLARIANALGSTTYHRLICVRRYILLRSGRFHLRDQGRAVSRKVPGVPGCTRRGVGSRGTDRMCLRAPQLGDIRLGEGPRLPCSARTLRQVFWRRRQRELPPPCPPPQT